MSTITIRGYCDVPSAAPGETIRFFVSSDRPGEYRADIVRLVHGDTNPNGPGFKEELLETRVSGSYPARFQRTQFGSYVEIADRGALHPRAGLTVHAFVWPTTPTRGRQGIVSRWADDVKAGWALAIEDGVLVFSVGDGSGTVSSVVSDRPLFQEVWYSVTASYDPGDASLALRQESVVNRVNSVFGPIVPLDSDTTVTATSAAVPGDAAVPVIVAGLSESSDGDRTWCIAPFNGKIDAPKVYGRALDETESARLAAGEPVAPGDLLARWDFAAGIGPSGIPTDRVVDVSGNGIDGICVNQPDRGMTGWNWQGLEEHFVHAPEQYGAIWFHEDSLDDCRWDVDFELTRAAEHEERLLRRPVEHGRRGGLRTLLRFAAPRNGDREDPLPRPDLQLSRLCQQPDHADRERRAGCHRAHATSQSLGRRAPRARRVLRPLDVRLPRGRPRGRVHVLATTDPEHAPQVPARVRSDPSVSGGPVPDRLAQRPGTLLRRRHRSRLDSRGRGSPERYNVVVTSSHPEYYTAGMIDAWEDYLCAGGRGMYVGANGIYWVVSLHPEKPWVMEVRKGETGAKAWQARPGELHHSTTGERGGLWRCRARAPQKIWGTGFTSFGFDHSGYFVPLPDARDDRVAWIMDGIDPEGPIGDFGLVGGGAAGWELDRYDRSLGTPPHTMLLAGSVEHSVNYYVVNEDVFFPHPGMSGGEHPFVRADIVYFTTPNGGAMFSTSSISWCGSLSWNDYDNNVSRMMNNVLTQFARDEPAPEL